MSNSTRVDFANVENGADVTVVFEDNRRASLLLGQYDQTLRQLEKRLAVQARVFGNYVTLHGAPDAVAHARRVLNMLYERTLSQAFITLEDVDGAIEETTQFENPSADLSDDHVKKQVFRHLTTRKRGMVRARTAAQDRYLSLMQEKELVFAAGPAGTGKTWLAVGYAISLLERGEVERLVLSRPAVEAGERLGFLPGDMREKVDPYLRPVYDALYDFMEPRLVERFMQTGVIEVAPLAFMRGRTLSHACVLLDEAQNTTPMQMKMFLTRFGEGSRMIITGDLSQIDLPNGQKSGMLDAMDLLSGIDRIGQLYFGVQDVVRHELVQKIVQAYESRK